MSLKLYDTYWLKVEELERIVTVQNISMIVILLLQIVMCHILRSQILEDLGKHRDKREVQKSAAIKLGFEVK